LNCSLSRKLSAQDPLCPGSYLPRKLSAQEAICPESYLPRKLSAQEAICPGSYQPRKLGYATVTPLPTGAQKQDSKSLIMINKKTANILARKP